MKSNFVVFSSYRNFTYKKNEQEENCFEPKYYDKLFLISSRVTKQLHKQLFFKCPFANLLCIAVQLYLYYYLDSKAAKSSPISFYILKSKSDNFSTFHNSKEIQLYTLPEDRWEMKSLILRFDNTCFSFNSTEHSQFGTTFQTIAL